MTARTALRNRLAAGAAARRARRDLERELSGYSPAELDELNALMARHTPEETADVERVLTGLARRRMYNAGSHAA